MRSWFHLECHQFCVLCADVRELKTEKEAVLGHLQRLKEQMASTRTRGRSALTQLTIDVSLHVFLEFFLCDFGVSALVILSTAS
jgi:hypothetical protein